MRRSMRHAAWLAAGMFVCVAGAKDAPAPDPKAVEVINQLGLAEGATALRELPGWRKPKRLVISMNGPVTANSQQALDALRAAAPDLEIVGVANTDEMIAKVADADAIAGGDDTVCDERVLAAAKKLRWVSVYSAGVEACLDKKGVNKPGLVVTNMKAVLGPVMSEHTTALMFALSRSLQVSVGRQATGEGWSGNFRGSEPQALTGKTLLVVGLGGIGTEVARRAHALGMKVIATRASSRKGPDFVSYVGLSDELPALIGQADVVVSTLPLVPSTTRLFDAKMFARMKKTAFFINVGRGGSVVTDDLVAALNSGTIAGAGLDVTEPEPLPKDHPLWKAKNIIITPHMSARSDLGQAIRELVLREQLRRFTAGDKLLSVVDLRKGY
ncbi:MAG: D-2-hydroxyacid dehydrogenase [Pseudomonadota bacterium]